MAIKFDFGGGMFDDEEKDKGLRFDFTGGTVDSGPASLDLLEPEPLPPPLVDSEPSLIPRSTNLETEIASGRMNPEFARKHPTIAKGIAGFGKLVAPIFENPWIERSGATGAEVRTMVDFPDKPTTGSTLGDISADLAGSIMGFIGNPVGGVESVGAKLWRGAEGAVEGIAPRIPALRNLPEAIGKGTEKVAPLIPGLKNIPDVAPMARGFTEYAGKIGGATAAFEGGRALANEREFDPLEMGLAAGANIGIDLATRGLLKGLSRRGTKTMVPEKDPGGFDFLQDVEYIPPDRLAIPPGRQPTDFTVDPYGVVKDVPEPTLALPEGRGKGITKYMLQDEGQTPWSDIGKDVAGNATHKLSDTPFTDVYQELQPRVTEQTIPPAESTKALTNYIHDYFKGEISKNEIRRMSYDNMLDMAESIAKGRKSDLWDTMRTEGEKAGYDVDLRYRLETDPEYRAEWERLREVSGLADEPIRFKKGVPEKVEADVTDTPEFGKWFGDSKVIDESGKPLVVYHNTPEKFNTFDVSKSRQSQDIPGFFFSNNPTEWADMGNRQVQAYLSINNPYTGDYSSYKGIKGGSTNTAYQEIRNALIKDGYDGIITKDGDSVEYIAFNPTQIKSVYNRGTWDPANPDIRFKQRDMTVQDYLDQIELQNAMTTRIGPFRIGKVGLAPEALEKPDFQAANDIAEKLGLRLVPFKGTRNRGMQVGRTIYLNKDMKDPLDYVFWHEVGHSMETTNPEHYGRLTDIAFEHVKNTEGMQKHYEGFRYTQEEIPHEFSADVFAEALSTPGFFARVADRAPELLKPLLQAIDNLVARVKSMISRDDTIVPYLKNLETLRERVRQEVAMPYFKDAMGEKQFVDTFSKHWQEPAAKAKLETDVPLDKRLAGDALLYVQDMITELKAIGADVSDSGYVTLYHRTSKQAADNILKTGKMRGKEDGIFFSTLREGQSEGFGDTVLEYRFPIEKLQLDDIFANEAHLRLPLRTRNQIADVSQYIISPKEEGFFTPTNPDIRYKLGEREASPIDDIKSMVEYGASQLHKGGYEHFTKLLQKKFPEVFERYDSEIANKLMSGVWFRAKELRSTGSTQIKLGDQVVTLGKGAEVASKVEPVRTRDEARIEEIDKEIESLQWRMQGTRKSKTKYPTSEAKNAHIKELQTEIDRLTKEREAASGTLLGGLDIKPSELKDIGGIRLGWQDMWRNMRDVFGDKFNAVKERVLDPLEDAKAAWVDHQRRLTDDLYDNVVDGLGIEKNSKESELVQLYGEGGYRHWQEAPKGIGKSVEAQQKWLERLEKKYGKGNVTLTDGGAEILKPFTHADLVKEVGEERAKDIIKAERWFRQKYDQLLEQVNAVRAQIYPGQQDKLVPKRKDYFRHFREMEGIEGVQNLFDTSAQISPELAGKSMYTRPKAKFHGFMQQRKLGRYKPDAVGGYLEYVPSATYAIHIDPQGAAFRQLERELVDIMGDNPGINKFLEYLKYYADDIQGKTNFFDRSFQALTSRKVFKGLVQLNNRIKANVILGNAGAILAQLSNIPQGINFAKQHSAAGLSRYVASAIKRARNPEEFATSNPMAQSRFLKERYSGEMYRRFDTKLGEKAKNVAVIGMEDTDRVATEFIWNACYEKAINTKGISDPVRYADLHARRLVAGRGIGEVPLMQKSKVVQLFAPFQVEVGNFLHVVRDTALNKDWGGLFVVLPTVLFLFNKVAEHTRGSGVTIDPLNAILDGIEMAQDDKDNKAYRIIGRMAGEIFSNMPGGQTVAAMAFDDYQRKQFFGREDPTRYGASVLVAKGLRDPLYHIVPPFGGLQARKTIRGMGMLKEGGAYTKDDRLKYPISDDPVNAAKGVIFGSGGFRETRDYYENEGRPLSEKQTEQLVRRGVGKGEAYNKIMHERKVNSLQSQIKETETDKSLSREERREKIRTLKRQLRELRRTGN